MEKYIVLRDIDYEGLYATEFTTLKEAQDFIRNHPRGHRDPSILAKVLTPQE